jgi:hypothetical protein
MATRLHAFYQRHLVVCAPEPLFPRLAIGGTVNTRPWLRLRSERRKYSASSDGSFVAVRVNSNKRS